MGLGPRSGADYADALLRLLPPGRLWRGLLGGSLWQGLIQALAAGLARFDAWAWQALIVEPDPRTTTQLISEWESSVGLPDGCIPRGGTLAQRRAAVVSRLNARGGASAAYYIGLAAVNGYNVTVEDLGPSHWRIHAGVTAMIWTTCNDDCDQPLQTFGNDQIECLFNRVKHAHTQLDFAYDAQTWH
ncbi:MAG: DUF2313 domain-containing protein [Sinobacteraceae bacterium]|nr:DUF2313 domain-containing protein [Nevskiaceae bacterium]